MDSDSESETSFMEQLISSRNRDHSVVLPLILGFSSSSRRDSQNLDQEPGPTHEGIILINPFTQGMIVIESNRSLDDLFRELSNKEGLPPASKKSIEAMPKVEITDEDRDGECSICLEGWEIGGEVKEMPCKHKYHSNCIEKWLGIHGSCPVCRFKMPIDDEEESKKSSSGGVGGEEQRRRTWMGFSFNSNNSRRDSNSTTSSNSDSSSSPRQEDDGNVTGSANSEDI